MLVIVVLVVVLLDVLVLAKGVFDFVVLVEKCCRRSVGVVPMVGEGLVVGMLVVVVLVVIV